MSDDLVCKKGSMMGASSGAGTAYPSGAPEFVPIFSGIPVDQYKNLYIYIHYILFMTYLKGKLITCVTKNHILQ